MFEITYTVNGIESTRNVRSETEKQAIEKLLAEIPDACVVRVVGPWKLS